MTVSGAQISLQPSRRFASTEVLVVLVLLALASGLVTGRLSAPRIGPREATQTAISTRWLADTPTVRTQVMDAMNAMPVRPSAYLVRGSVAQLVMEHMNELGRDDLAVEGPRSTVAYRVMDHMNEILRGRTR